MTTERRDGNDSPFGAWMRSRTDLDSVSHGLYITDIDWNVHKYKTWDDSSGKRDVKLMVDFELKTNCAFPSPQQKETLYLRHQLLCRKSHVYSTYVQKNVRLWHFGNCILILSGDRPDRSVSMRWYVFGHKGKATPYKITEDELAGILDFRLRPDNPKKKLSLRRHHSTRTLMVPEDGGLFPNERPVLKRS